MADSPVAGPLGVAGTLRKWRGRVATVVEHSFSSLLPPVFNVLISMLVVRIASPALWGELVDVIVIAQLGVHIIAWGNKEHLLRQFSTTDSGHGTAWLSSLVTRFTQVLPPVCAGVIGYGLWIQDWSAAVIAPCLLWIVAQSVVQSHEVVVLFHRVFKRQIAVELTGTGAIIATLIAVLPAISAVELLWLFAAVTVAKAVALHALTRRLLGDLSTIAADGGLLRATAAFFLLGLTGMLVSRVDLYTVAALLDAAELARYQVLLNMLLYLQMMANLILMPFVRDVYGMSVADIHKLAGRFVALGAVLSAGGVAVVGLVVHYGYQMPVDAPLLAIAYGYVLQMYLAVPMMYSLFKTNSESTVLKVSVAIIATNLAGNLALIKRFGLHGALFSSFLVSFGGALFYTWLSARLRADEANR